MFSIYGVWCSAHWPVLVCLHPLRAYSLCQSRSASKKLCIYKTDWTPDTNVVLYLIEISQHARCIMAKLVEQYFWGDADNSSFQSHCQTQSLSVGRQCYEACADSASVGLVWSHPSPCISIIYDPETLKADKSPSVRSDLWLLMLYHISHLH